MICFRGHSVGNFVSAALTGFVSADIPLETLYFRSHTTFISQKAGVHIHTYDFLAICACESL